MINRSSTIIVPVMVLLTHSLCGCVTRTIASPECPQPAPLSAKLQAPAPDPLLFEKCKAEFLAQTSEQGLTPSCKQLNDWRLSTLNGSGADDQMVPSKARPSGDSSVPARH